MQWGIPISLYLFLAGASAGAFALALGLSAWSRRESAGDGARELTAKTRLIGFAVAPALLAIGAVFLIVDASAGLSHPLSYLGVFTNLGSVMTWGAWIILLSLVAQLVALSVSAGKREVAPGVRKAGTVAGLVLAAALAIYTAILLGVVSPAPLWNSAALVVLFALSAGLSGAALVFLVGLVIDRENTATLVAHLETPILVAEVAEIVTLATHLAITASRGTAGVSSVQSLVSGDYAAAFWIGLVALGIVLPLVVNGVSAVRTSHQAKSSEAAATTSAAAKGAVLLALAGTILGAVVLRIVIIGAAQFTVISSF